MSTPTAGYRRRARRGYSLAEGILGLAIIAAFVVGVTRLITYSTNTQQSRAMATRMSLLSQAADAYIKNFGPNIAYAVSTGDAVTIPMTANAADHPEIQSGQSGLPSFQEAGVLGANFQDRNTNGQKTALIVMKGQNGQGFEAFLVNYGGEATPDVILAGAEGMSEGRVGAVLAQDPAATQDSAGAAARGSRGGWAAPVSSFANVGVALAPAPGHLVSYISLNKGGLTDSDSEYLCRHKTANPACNAMTTDIDMGGNNINNVSVINSTGTPTKVGGNLEVVGDTTTDGDSTVDGSQHIVQNQKVDGSQEVTNQTVDANQTVNGNQTVGGSSTVSGNQNVGGNIYSTTNGAPNTQYYVNPAGTTLLASLNVDTKATSNIRPSLDGVPIAQLIPSHVVKATYLATDGATISKPDCVNAQGVPKIFAFPVGQYNASQPQTDIAANVNYTEVTVYAPNGAVPTTTTVNSINPKSNPDPTKCDTTQDGLCVSATTTATESYNEMSAQDAGTSWILHLYTYATDPTLDPTQGETLTQLNDRAGFRNQALVQTACYYP